MTTTVLVPAAEPTATLERRDAPPARRLSWDVIRVLAITSVVVQHATYTVAGVLPQLSRTPFTWSVEAGANTLMVLSAFFAATLLSQGRPGRWWVRRLARLIPAYLVAVVLTYAATLVASGHGYWRPGVHDLVGNLLLMQSWDPQVVYLDHSYWTLPAQLTMFTLSAVAAAHLGREFWRLRWTLPTVAWTVVVLPVLVLWVDDATGWSRATFDGLVMYRWQLFGIGLAVWLWSRRRLGTWHVLALTTVGVVAEQIQTSDLPSTLVLGVGCVAVALAARGPDWSWLRRVGPVARAIRWLAGISFGVYLLNQQLGYFEAWLLEARFGITGWPRLLLVLATVVLLGWLITALVERPAYRLLTRARSAGSADPTAAEGSAVPAWGVSGRGNDSAAASSRSFCSGEPTVIRTP